MANQTVRSGKAKPREKRLAPKPEKKVVGPNKQTQHHRKPRSAGGDRRRGNISNVEHRFHDAYHKIFGPGLPHSVAEILNKIWIDPEYVMVAMKKTDFEKVKRYLQNKGVL